MAKTKPIGVRFDETTFEKLKKMGYSTHQKALGFLERFWDEAVPKLIEFNNQPLNKERILKERSGKTILDATKPSNEVKPIEQPQTNYVIDTERIAELEKELAAVPDPTKGFGKQLADSIKKKIFNLKFPRQ